MKKEVTVCQVAPSKVWNVPWVTLETVYVKLVADGIVMHYVTAVQTCALPFLTANDAAVITGAASLVKVTVPTNVLLWWLTASPLSTCTENVGDRKSVV